MECHKEIHNIKWLSHTQPIHLLWGKWLKMCFKILVFKAEICQPYTASTFFIRSCGLPGKKQVFNVLQATDKHQQWRCICKSVWSFVLSLCACVLYCLFISLWLWKHIGHNKHKSGGFFLGGGRRFNHINLFNPETLLATLTTWHFHI